MIKLYVIIFILSVSTCRLEAQNLVPNPSFESYLHCPEDINYNKKKLIPNQWFSPTRGTADYFNSCSRFNVSVPVNIMGSMFAADSKAYVGLILLEKPDYMNFDNKKPFNYREYITCKLNKNLEKNTIYIISLRYAVAGFSTYIVDRLGVAVTKNKPYKLGDKNLSLIPSVYITANIDTLKQSYWYTLEGSYKATGEEKYLTIGNFYNDENTLFIKPDYTDVPKTRMDRLIEDGFAYYYIDDISVTVQMKY